MPDVDEKVVKCNGLLKSANDNICEFLSCENLPDWARGSVTELLARREYAELNDRFFRTSEFGTGGIRGRAIGKVLTKCELGGSDSDIPEHASVGSTFVNDFSIIRATMALFRYCRKYLDNSSRAHEPPSVVIAHDARFFSRHFCELCASVWLQLGGYAMIFIGPRSTPQLSFSVRYLHATAGIMLTASHNPWYDSGFKAYFMDGAQMVDPHASGVIQEYGMIPLAEVGQFLAKDLSRVSVLGKYVDSAYLEAVGETVLDKSLLKKFSPSVIFTPLHGVGAISTIPLMEKFGIKYGVVESQNDLDPKFRSVKSPNPEDKDALQLAVGEAESRGCDIVLATDSDGDRVAIAARSKVGEFEYFSGNVAWSLLAEYRLSRWKEQGFLDTSNGNNIAIVKTFVTTPLLDRIAQNFGVKCVNTLTGFKWIGEKMASYEREMLAKIENKFDGVVLNYGATSAIKRRELLAKYSTFFAFGCEESYGCLSSDIVRDKDANSGVLMLCELAAYAKQRGTTLCELRDEMFKKYGYFGESILNIYYDGADGVEKIANILLSYRELKPEFIGGARVTKFTDFMAEELFDADGKKIPKQNFFFIELENGCQFAVRASGTEPKIKFYMFCECKTPGDLNLDKQRLEALLSEMKIFLARDADIRSKFRA